MSAHLKTWELEARNREFQEAEFPPLTLKSAAIAALTVVLAMAASALLPLWGTH
jgi:hypothetical protein